MNDKPSQTVVLGRPSKTGRILSEALLVAASVAVLAFAANQVSPRGLALTRDYFPTGTAHEVRTVANTGPPPATGTNPAALSAAQFLAAQMKEKGLQLIDSVQVQRLFHDPHFRQDIVVFIDARDEARYQQSHIPGAYEFDPYHPEKYLNAVLPLCQKAEQVVVYCNGGNCDDSESAALLLRDIGISNQKIFVYGGGITEWKADNLPVEIGARNSGNLGNTNK